MGNKTHQNDNNWGYMQPLSPIDVAIKTAQAKGKKVIEDRKKREQFYQTLPEPYVTPEGKWFLEATKPVIGTVIKNSGWMLLPNALKPIGLINRFVDYNVIKPVPKHSAENMKSHLTFMWNEFLAERNKYMGDEPYTSAEDYFKRTGVKEVQLPFTVFDYKTTTKIPTPSTEFVNALERMDQSKDYSLNSNSFSNYLNYYNSDYFNTLPTTKQLPGAEKRYAEYYKYKTGKNRNKKTDPSDITVGKYDWVVTNDNIARIKPDDYDFDLTLKEAWRSLTKGGGFDKVRTVLQPFLGGGRSHIQTLEVPMSDIEKEK